MAKAASTTPPTGKTSNSDRFERFADYFVVCGLDEKIGLERHQIHDSIQNHLSPLQLSYKANILWHFPENEDSNPFEGDGIKMLCMPRGVIFQKSEKKIKHKFHSFLQTREDGTKFYGFVLTFYEKIVNDDIIIAMETLFKMFQADCTSKSPSHNPNGEHQLLEKKGSFTFYNKEAENLYISKCLCLIMRKPFLTAARACLESILKVGLNENEFSLPVESYIYNVLYEIPSPPPGRTMKYTAVSGDSIIILYPDKNDLPYFDYSMKEVLMTLGFENLVDLFTCMLLEHQILLLASDIHKLMLIAECLTILFFPLLWQHVYVPVLPPWLRHFLDAPVPFIMGLYYESEEEKDRFEIPCEGNICLLDIDSNDIQLPQEVPELPGRDDLIKELKTMADTYGIQPPQGSLRLRFQQEESSQSFDESSSNFDDSDSYINLSTKHYTGTWPRKQSLSPKINPNNVNIVSPLMSRRRMTNSSPSVIANSSPTAVANGALTKSTSSVQSDLNNSFDNSNNKLTSTPEKVLTEKSLLGSAEKSKNPRIAAILAIVEKVGIEMNTDTNTSGETTPNNSLVKDDLHVYNSRAVTVTRKQQHEDEFNIIVREIFVNRFTQMLVDYEHFVILPQQSKEDWINNREHMQNFDKASFLSDQSQMHLPFMTLFVETQGFASLIDMKIMALWEDSDPRLSFFDKRIDKLKVKLGIIRSDAYKQCDSIPNAIECYIKRCSNVDHNAAQAHSLKGSIQRDKADNYFPIPEKLALQETRRKKASRIRWSKREKIQQQQEHVSLNAALKVSQLEGQKMKEKLAEKVKKYMQDSKTLTKENAARTGGSSSGGQKTLSAFADKLLRECKLKTNRLVVLKLGQEAVELGHGGQNILGIEENTLIASLCDLLERVWSHGVQLRQLDFGKESAKSKFVQRMRQSKSALWSHLITFYHKENERLRMIYGLSSDSENLTTDIKRHLSEFNHPSHRKQSSVDAFTENLSRAIRSKSPDSDIEYSREADRLIDRSPRASPPTTPGSDLKHQQDLLARLSFLDDLRNILDMKEIKTDTGYARAWTRLALEKKVLAKNLRMLLNNKKILHLRYKDYAFIRTTDEMEQFLSHLLSLSAVDFFCFTNGFLSTVVTYKVNIVLGKQIGAATSASTWIDVTGTSSSTGKINTPKGEIEFRFKDKNLGILTSLRIGHDNSGMSPGWFIEYVAVTNEITGQLFSFQCGRWLARNEDDGSIERLLVAEMLNQKRMTGKHPAISSKPHASERSAVIAAPSSDRRMSVFTKKLTSGDIQEKVADSVNNIVKYFYKDSEENMTFLLCGEDGFCEAFTHVFRYGYRCSRLFGKKLFIWDFIEKLYDFYVNIDSSNASLSSQELKLRTTLCTTIQTINTQSQSIGKDQKFQLFICLGLRDSQLQNWFRLLNESPITCQMYEPYSFFRDQSLISFLIDVLEALAGFEILLDKSITRGI